MKKIMAILGLVFILTACNNENINGKHVTYIENLGWTIESLKSNRQEDIEISEDSMESYNSANITFIENYVGKKLSITSCKLNEKDFEGDNILVDLYEYEGEIVGSIGRLPNATPGIFNLADKKVPENKQIEN